MSENPQVQSYMYQAAVMPMDLASVEAAPDIDQTTQSVLDYIRWKRNKLLGNLGTVSLLILILFAVLAIIKAFLMNGNLPLAFSWLIEILPKTPPENVGDFAAILAPLVAIAVAIERLLEQFFDYLEMSLINMADFLKAPVEFLKVLQDEYRRAYSAVQEATQTAAASDTPKSQKALDTAKSKLMQVEDQVRNSIQTPEYIAWKRYITLLIAFIAGIIVAVFGDLGMLRTIGLPTPRLFDMLLTGLVIGAGPGPMHSIIGILQNGKDALGKLAETSKTNPLQGSIDELKQEIEALKKNPRG